MGYISKNLNRNVPKGVLRTERPSREVWREVFGTNKEERLKQPLDGIQPVTPGGSYVRSTSSSSASIARLVQAFRSMAPGGWTDDRYEQTKHFVSIPYVCINRMCEQLAQSELKVYQKDDNHPDGKREVTPYDPPHGNRLVRPYELVELLKRPNEEDSFGDLMYRLNQQIDLTGVALMWMVPNQLGVPMELYPVPTAIAVPQPAINPDYPDGYYRIQPLYPYGPFSSYPTPTTAVGAPIPAQWMLRFLMPHPLVRYDGYSPLTALRLHVDEVESIDRSRWYSMKRSINPSAVVNFDNMEGSEPLPEQEIERIRAEWEMDFQSPENHGRLIVAPPGGSVQPWGNSPKDMEYQSGWEQLVSFVMAGYGITRPAAGMIDDSSYSTLFATLKQLHLLTLQPKCNRISNRLTRNLAPFFGDDLIVEIKCPRIDDHDVRNAKLGLLMQARAITKNEFRREMDMPVTPESWGNEIAGMEPVLLPGGAPNPMMLPPGAPPMGGPAVPTGLDQLLPSDVVHPDEEVMTELEMQGVPPQEAQRMSQGRPMPGNAGAGSLGPRKSIKKYFVKNGFNGHTNGVK